MGRGTAVVTGASSGIGAATARRLRDEGWDVVVGARRADRLEEVAAGIGARAVTLDVTDTESVQAFAAEVPECTLLVNNAGGARGLAPIAEADEEEWRWMYDANVLGVMRVTRALLPALERSGRGHVVIVSSVAGSEVYERGGGYTASKHATRALARTLRLELFGRPVRVTDLAPGMVHTEFSRARFGGDEEAGERPYRGLTPLSPEDIADCIAWAATRPPHVNVDVIEVRPLAQVGVMRFDREEAPAAQSS
jgi:NADP-dependent 3-hydroxy acid dehydrogenase YdfG